MSGDAKAWLWAAILVTLFLIVLTLGLIWNAHYQSQQLVHKLSQCTHLKTALLQLDCVNNLIGGN